MKPKKLELKKLTIAQLTAIVGGEAEVETAAVCTTVPVNNMPALPTFACKLPDPIAER